MPKNRAALGFLVSQSHASSHAETRLSTAACEMELATRLHELSRMTGFHTDLGTERLISDTLWKI